MNKKRPPKDEEVLGSVESVVNPPETPNLPQKFDPERIIAKAIEHKIDVAAMKELLEMRRQLKAEQAKESFFNALSGFQSKCPIIAKKWEVKNREGVVIYRFAPLDEIQRVVAPFLREFGLSYRFDTELKEIDKIKFKITHCIVSHVDGHSESSSFSVPIEESSKLINGAQMHGSAGSYSKRYAFCNAFGILTGDEDNDGQDAGPVKSEKAAGSVAGKVNDSGKQCPSCHCPAGKKHTDKCKFEPGDAKPPVTPFEKSPLDKQPTPSGVLDSERELSAARQVEDGREKIIKDILEAGHKLLSLMLPKSVKPGSDLWKMEGVKLRKKFFNGATFEEMKYMDEDTLLNGLQGIEYEISGFMDGVDEKEPE